MRGITSARLVAPIGRIAVSVLLACMLAFCMTPSAWALTSATDTKNETQTLASESENEPSNESPSKTPNDDGAFEAKGEGQDAQDPAGDQEGPASEDLIHEGSTGEEDAQAANGANALIGTATGPQAENTKTIQNSTKSDDAASEKTLSASVKLIGVDSSGKAQTWANNQTIEISQSEGEANITVADATEAFFKQAGIAATIDYSWGWFLQSVTSPFNGMAYEWNTLGDGAYWRLFVNGEEYENQIDEETFASPTIHNGDVISWQYLPAESEGIDPSTITSTPNAERPNYNADWSGFGNGGTQTSVTAQTPATDGKAEWTVAVKDSTDWQSGLSDPVIAGEFLYQVAGNKIQKIETKTGTIVAEATLAKSIDYTARTVYTDGLVVVPLSGGQLQALTADSLTPVWLSEAIPGGEYLQCLSSLTVSNGSVFFAASNAGWSTTTGGFKVSVSLKDGSINWIEENGEKGYYWSGFSLVNGYLITVGDQGIVECLDPETGKAVSSGLAIACGARSSITVAEDGKTAFFSDVQGTLHRITVEEDGSVRETGSVSFAPGSTSTPVLANGKVFVGGDTTDYKGVLAVIDAETMTVEHSITSAAGAALPGPVKSTPLVSVQGSAVYAYFACNTKPGGIYVYKLGDSEASALFTPEGTQANYCMASPICDSEGNLYYTNDSGTLFKVSGKAGVNEGGNGGADGNDTPIAPGEGGSSEDGSSIGGAGGTGSASDEAGLNLVRAALGYVAANQRPLSASSEASVQAGSEEGAVPSSAESGSGASDARDGGGAEEPNGIGAWMPVVGIGVGVVALLGVVAFVLSRLRVGASGAASASAANDNVNRTRRS